MTRGHVKEVLPFIQAYAEGKPVEFTLDGINWNPCTNPAFMHNADCYRIVPEPIMRPMTRGEVLYKVTTTPGMVCKMVSKLCGEEGPEAAQKWSFYDNDIEMYRWAIIDVRGEPVDGWHKFEVEA